MYNDNYETMCDPNVDWAECDNLEDVLDRMDYDIQSSLDLFDDNLNHLD